MLTKRLEPGLLLLGSGVNTDFPTSQKMYVKLISVLTLFYACNRYHFQGIPCLRLYQHRQLQHLTEDHNVKHAQQVQNHTSQTD